MSDLPPIKTRVAGVSFDNRDGTPRQPYVKLAKKGDVLALKREPDNPFDGNAIAVAWTEPTGAHLTAEVVRRGQARPGPGKPLLYGVRMSIDGDLSALAAHWRSGLEPAVAAALAMPDDEPMEQLAPALGGRQAVS